MERNIELRTDYLKSDPDKLKMAVMLLGDTSYLYGLEKPNDNTIRRWLSKERIPVVGYLIVIAKAYNTNISFLLKRTNNNAPNDRYFSTKARVDEARELSGYSSRKTFCQKFNFNYTTMSAYERSDIKYQSNQTLGTLLELSDNLAVSIDYLLGLSDKTEWELSSPLSGIRAGTPIGIKSADSYTTGLITTDHKGVVFPDGHILPITDPFFKNTEITVYEEGYKLN